MGLLCRASHVAHNTALPLTVGPRTWTMLLWVFALAPEASHSCEEPEPSSSTGPAGFVAVWSACQTGLLPLGS